MSNRGEIIRQRVIASKSPLARHSLNQKQIGDEYQGRKKVDKEIFQSRNREVGHFEDGILWNGTRGKVAVFGPLKNRINI